MLADKLSSALPKGHNFEVLHLQSPPNETHPIVTKQNSRQDGTNVKTKHLFFLMHQEKVFYGLEIYIYITKFRESDKPLERLLFVSKADTNGYCDIKVDIKLVTRQIMDFLLAIDPNYYLTEIIPAKRNYKRAKVEKVITRGSSPEETLRILAERLKDNTSVDKVNIEKYYKHLGTETSPNVIEKICLFTRPADQYLFPDSAKNNKKHVLDGDGLLRWWASLVDQILVQNFDENTTVAKIRIPGEDKYRVKRYTNQLKFPKWSNGDIFDDNENSLAVFTVPMFPDDPKSRFIRDIVDENLTQKKTLRAFWTELQERQEFKLSVTVSVMGVTGNTLRSPMYKPDSKDVLRTKSKKQFKYLKNYVTGEEYDTEEGPQEAYTNVVDSLQRMNTELIKVTGTTDYKLKSNGPKPLQINTLQVRRKK